MDISYQAAAIIDSISNTAQHYFPTLVQHRYLLLFIATCFEGFNTAILAGFLVSIGKLDLLPTFLVCLAGEFVNSSVWFGIGYWGGAKPIDWMVRNSPRKKNFINRIRKYLENYTGRVILILKLTYSVTVPGLILAGSTKYSPQKFSFYNFIGSIGWVIMMFAIGAFFGQGYQHYATYFANVSYLIVFIVIAVLILGFAEHFGGVFMEYFVLVGDKLRQAGERISGSLEKLTGPEGKDKNVNK